jgi:hypothetical protein
MRSLIKKSSTAFFAGVLMLAAAQSAWPLGYPIIFDGDTVKIISGAWWGDKSGKTILSQTTEEFHSGTSCLKIDMNWDPGYYGAAWGWNWAGWGVMGQYDARNATAVEMWVKGNVSWGWMNIWLTDGNAKSSAIKTINNLTTSWQKFTIAITDFSGIDLSKVWEIAGDTHALYGSGYIMYLDDVKFVDPAYQSVRQPVQSRLIHDRNRGASYLIAGNASSRKEISGNHAAALYDIRGAALHHSAATGVVILRQQQHP